MRTCGGAMTIGCTARRILQKSGEVLLFMARRVYQTPQEKGVIPWLRDEGDKTLRLNYGLDATSLVFDLGGYEGQWASDIFSMYLAHIHVFEPVPQYAESIRHRFGRNPKVIVHGFGLSSDNGTARISMAGASSSLYRAGSLYADVRFVRAADFIRDNHIGQIDLIKINIEGGEYDLLEHLIETGLVRNTVNIQVQFHDFVPAAGPRMLAIQKSLAVTHVLTYQYPFVWENWRRQV